MELFSLICFVCAHVIYIFVTHVPSCLNAIADEIKFIYLFHLFNSAYIFCDGFTTIILIVMCCEILAE